MVHPIVVLILLLIDAATVLTNQAVFQAPVTLTIPWSPGQTWAVAWQWIMIAAGAALVVAWIAGLIDRAGLDRHLQNCETTMRAMSDEMLRLKASTYDQERQPLADIRTRLDALDRDIRGLRARLDREPLPRPEDTIRAGPTETTAAAGLRP